MAMGGVLETTGTHVLIKPPEPLDFSDPNAWARWKVHFDRFINLSVWFEPTDIRKASLPFITDLWKNLHFVSPNFNELRIMAKAAGITVGNSKHCDGDDLLKEARTLSVALAEHIAVVVVTLGKLGVLIARRGHCGDVLIPKEGCRHGDHSGAILPVSSRMYYVPEFSDVVSVSGAGDCLAAGFIAGALSRLSEEQCVAVGASAARLSLQSAAAVPATLFDVGDWGTTCSSRAFLHSAANQLKLAAYSVVLEPRFQSLEHELLQIPNTAL